MRVVSFIEPPQADVIEEILKHCGLWQSRSPRAPPDVHDLVLELDAAYSGSSIELPDQADQSQELTYVDITPSWRAPHSSPTEIGTGAMRQRSGIASYFAHRLAFCTQVGPLN